MKPKFLILALLIGLAYLAILALGARFEAEGKAAQTELEEMFRTVHPMADATGSDYRVTRKSRQITITGEFESQRPWPEIRAYYEAELPKHGWRLVHDESLERFRNGRYGAHLVPKQSGYVLYFGWGIY